MILDWIFRLLLGDHTAYFGLHVMIQAHKLVCMHSSFLHAWVHVLAQMGQIREN